MRKNCREALRAFQSGRAARPADSIWTDGETIWSYSTALVTRTPVGRLVLNRTKYSPTTSNHQTALAADLPQAIVVTDLPRGVMPAELVRRAIPDLHASI